MKLTINKINQILELNETITVSELKSIIDIWCYCKMNYLACDILNNCINHMYLDMGTLEEYNEEILYLLLQLGLITYEI